MVGRIAATALLLVLLAAGPCCAGTQQPVLSEPRHGGREPGARVAVIGAGVGGGMTAHHLAKLDSGITIDVFEAGEVGGRTAEVVLHGKVYELGASIIWGGNQHVMGAARELGLTPVRPEGEQPTNIFDGRRFLFRESRWWLVNVARGVLRYGLALPAFSRLVAAAWQQRFSRVYALQEQQGASFATPEELLRAMGLYELTQASLPSVAASQLAGPWSWGLARLMNELVGAASRVNYNQRNAQLNAMAGFVSFLPAADPDVWQLREGNARLAERLLQAAGAAVLAGYRVAAVERAPDGRYQLQCSQAQGSPSVQLQAYDAVVLAVPLELANISFAGLQLPLLPPRKFQATVTSMVQGVLAPAYFGLHRGSMPPGDVLASDDATMPWTVLADKGPAGCGGGEQRQQQQGAGLSAAPAADGGGGGAAAAGVAAAAMCGAAASPVACGAAAAAADVAASRRLQGAHASEGDGGSAGTGGRQAGGGGCEPGARLYKLFSTEPLQQEELARLFKSHQVLASRRWLAYPQFSPPEQFSPFVLGPGLFYNNAIENIASAMEMSAIAGKNSALLVAQHLREAAAAR